MLCLWLEWEGQLMLIIWLLFDVGIEIMREDQLKMLHERQAKLKKKLQSNPANKDKIEGELKEVEGQLKKAVSTV